MPSSLVDLSDIDKTIVQDLRYATENNFLGIVLYPVARCLLRRVVAEALSRVQTDLRRTDRGLKVFDAYRPLSVQKILWAHLPDPRYVADPAAGSVHNRGAAVDVTLVHLNGDELEMPSGYDEFSARAHRDYCGGSPRALENRGDLENAMVRQGFIPFPTEWWHFDYQKYSDFPLEDLPL